MKKKILLFSLMVAILVCAFAICVSAEDNIIKLDKLPTLDEIHANREAYVSYVEALEDETTYKAADPDSVIVLSDLAATPTYYVYPAYYLIRSTYYSIAGNLSKFNDAILASDPTAFAGYKSDGGNWGNGECDYVIRLEFPKYVTQIAAQYKFEGSVNIKEIYFPIHTVIDEETGLEKTVPYCATISGQNLFGNCYALEVIHNQEYLPKELVQGNNGGFYACKSLKEFYIPDGVTHIPASFFYDCNALTEITLPNTVKSAGKMAFGSCDSLTTFRFGASFTTFYSPNTDFEHFLSSPNVKYFYMPDAEYKFLYDNGNTATRFANIFNAGSKVTFFYTGTAEKAKAMQDAFVASTANDTIANATIVEYDPNINYEGYADTLGYSIIVCNYNKCDAFYQGDHDEKAPYNAFKGDKYITDYCTFEECSRCPKIIETKLNGPLFTSKGYSKSDDAFMFDMKVDFDAMAKYEALGNTAPSYGLVVSANATINELIGLDGEVTDTSVLKVNFNEGIYNNVQVRLNNILTDTSKAIKVHVCAYIIDGESVAYVGEGKATTTSTMICYNDIQGEEDVTPEVTPQE